MLSFGFRPSFAHCCAVAPGFSRNLNLKLRPRGTSWYSGCPTTTATPWRSMLASRADKWMRRTRRRGGRVLGGIQDASDSQCLRIRAHPIGSSPRGCQGLSAFRAARWSLCPAFLFSSCLRWVQCPHARQAEAQASAAEPAHAATQAQGRPGPPWALGLGLQLSALCPVQAGQAASRSRTGNAEASPWSEGLCGLCPGYPGFGKRGHEAE